MSCLCYPVGALVQFASTLLERAGLPREKAIVFATVLVTADQLGHDTHGLELLGPFLEEISHGRMTRDGEHLVMTRRPAAQTWDGRRLPGPWLITRAVDAAAEMAQHCGVGTVAVRRSHRIGCLAAYLLRATDRGLVVVIESCEPSVRIVVPHGGVTPVMTPNPIAVGLPTSGTPILIDVSTSSTSYGFAKKCSESDTALPGPWLIDALGFATRDPNVLFQTPKGAILPLGGLDAGHKGFGLGLMIESLAGGLAGFGRADPAEGWGSTVLVQVFDPEAFSGLDEFKRQTDHLARVCRESTPRTGVDAVRVPGDRAMALYAEREMSGIPVAASIMESLLPWSNDLGVALP